VYSSVKCKNIFVNINGLPINLCPRRKVPGIGFQYFAKLS
jgi:hypothetical protein